MPARLGLALLLTCILASLHDGGARRPTVADAAPGDIATFAGGGVGDGGGATNAAVSAYGVAADGAGNLYIADADNCRIRKVAGGVITTVAGTGVCGFSGDGGAATVARIGQAESVALDGAGNVYLADTTNCRVRKVTAGTISTVAGNGLCMFGGDSGAATSAGLASPAAVAVDGNGTLYIADTGNCRVRKVSGGVITTLAGTGACGSTGDSGPAANAGVTHVRGVAVDSTGTVYIADTDGCRVRVVAFPSANIFTAAGTGTCGFSGEGALATSAQLDGPRGVGTDAAGDVYIADSDNCRVRKLTYPARTLTTVAGSAACGFAGDGGAATSAQLAAPAAVTVGGGGELFIADRGNCRMRRVAAGIISTHAGTGSCFYGGDGGAATNAALGTPGEVALDAAGNAYVADPANCRVRKVAAGGAISTLAGNGACTFGGDGGTATAASLNAPRGVAADPSGNVYIADTDNCRVRKVTGGTITTVAGTGACDYGGDGGPATAAMLNHPQSVAVVGSTVFIADTFNCRIRRISGGVITTLAGDGSCSYAGDGGAAVDASLTFPYGIASDAGANVYIADTLNCRVRRVTAGMITLVAGNGACAYGGDGGAATAASLNHPLGVAVDANGHVYVADTDNCRVRQVSGGSMITVAGIGTGTDFGGCGFAGDGGPGTAAQLDRPQDVAIAAGTLYIADGLNRRVRTLTAGADHDGDGVANTTDNCIITSNAGQQNSDRNFVDVTPPRPAGQDDVTNVNSDESGDACDADDDNDTLADGAESAGVPCATATAATNPLLRDTDGDRVTDGAECALGSNPNDAASKPAVVVAPDADSDGVPDAYDPNDAAFDSDGDGLSDRIEFRGYSSNLANANSDADSCGDAREAASVDVNATVGASDLGIIASLFGNPGGHANMDVDKNGAIGASDLGLAATAFGSCP